LVASARAQRAVTRQQCRAAARRFVRRHRRDASYLAWVLRSVAASSALALALLGLGAEPAGAKATVFTYQTGAADPFRTLDLAISTHPVFADLDGDGDLDLVAAGYDYPPRFRYFENTGSASNPVFVQRTGSQNPLDGLDAGSRRAYPALA